MFQVNPSSLISTLVESLLPRHSPKETVLVMSFMASAQPIGFGVDDRTFLRNFHMMFHRPGNYTKVLWFDDVSSSNLLQLGTPRIWSLRANHDSCWRNDGVEQSLSALQQEIARKWGRSIPELQFELVLVSALGKSGLGLFTLEQFDEIERDRTFQAVLK
jgi:hypothetical protein